MATIHTIDTSIDLLRVLSWQRSNAVNAQALLQAMQEWADANIQTFWDDWYTDVFCLDTANDFGLTVWAIILDQPLLATLPVSTSSRKPWGFGTNNRNFGQSNFRRQRAGTASLSTSQRRALLKMRYLRLISRGTIPEINRALAILSAGEGKAYAIKGDDPASLLILFDYSPSAAIRQVLDTMDVIPHAAGVGTTISYPYTPFGVNEAEAPPGTRQNLSKAHFASE